MTGGFALRAEKWQASSAADGNRKTSRAAGRRTSEGMGDAICTVRSSTIADKSSRAHSCPIPMSVACRIFPWKNWLLAMSVDLLMRREPLGPGEKANCPRCGFELAAHRHQWKRRCFALVLTALFLLYPSQFPADHESQPARPDPQRYGLDGSARSLRQWHAGRRHPGIPVQHGDPVGQVALPVAGDDQRAFRYRPSHRHAALPRLSPSARSGGCSRSTSWVSWFPSSS